MYEMPKHTEITTSTAADIINIGDSGSSIDSPIKIVHIIPGRVPSIEPSIYFHQLIFVEPKNILTTS